MNDRHKRYYAPKCFAQEADRLFAVGVIRIETYGRVNPPRPPHRASRLTGAPAISLHVTK